MGQNTSTAVMQRRAEPHDSLDFFPAPAWATRALCHYLAQGNDLSRQRAWEPAKRLRGIRALQFEPVNGVEWAYANAWMAGP